MTACPQEISITYNSFVIDNTNKDKYLVLDNSWDISYSDVDATLSFKVLVMGAGATKALEIADFETNLSALHEAYRDIRKTLIITHDGTTFHTFTASDTTDSDSKPTLSWVDDEHFTHRSSVYNVSIRVTTPALTARTNEALTVTHDESDIRTITCTAFYRATASLAAKAEMDANFTSFVTICKDFVDDAATWEVIQVPNTNLQPIINNEAQKSITLRELIYDQSSLGRDDTDLIDVVINHGLQRDWSHGDTLPSQAETFFLKKNVERILNVTGTINARVIKTNLSLDAVWEDKLRPYLLEDIKDKFDLNLVALTIDNKSIQRDNNRITCDFTAQGAQSGTGQIISAKVTIHEALQIGNKIIDAADGTDFGAYFQKVKSKFVRTITENVVYISDEKVGTGNPGGGGGNVGIGLGGGGIGIDGGDPFGGFIGISDSPAKLSFGGGDGSGGNVGIGAGAGGGEGKPKWLDQTKDDSKTPQVLGNVAVSDENFSIVERVVTTTQRWYVPWSPKKSGSGGGISVTTPGT